MKKNVIVAAKRTGKQISGNAGSRELRRTVSGELRSLLEAAENSHNNRWAAIKGRSQKSVLYSGKN